MFYVPFFSSLSSIVNKNQLPSSSNLIKQYDDAKAQEELVAWLENQGPEVLDEERGAGPRVGMAESASAEPGKRPCQERGVAGVVFRTGKTRPRTWS